MSWPIVLDMLGEKWKCASTLLLRFVLRVALQLGMQEGVIYLPSPHLLGKNFVVCYQVRLVSVHGH